MSAYAGPEIVNSGLVLSLDAANPRSYPGSGTTWTDLSGNGLNGSMSNVTYNSGNGGYMSFNGTTSIVDCGTSDTLFSSTSLTIETVIYPVSYGGLTYGRIIDRSAATTIGYRFTMDNSGSTGSAGVVYAHNAGAAGTTAFTANNSVTLSSWHAFTITLSGSTAVSYYKNGSLLSSYTYGAMTSGTTNFYIGNRSALDRGFDGRIAFVKVYNRTLTAGEVRQNFNALRGRYGI